MATMTLFSVPLRNLLLLDAATCAAMGTLLMVGASWIAAFTDIPAALLFYAGVALVPIAAFMAIVAVRAAAPRGAVAAIVAGNLLWVIGSVWLMLGPWITPNAIGHAFIGAQAAAVAVLAAFEGLAMPRSTGLPQASLRAPSR